MAYTFEGEPTTIKAVAKRARCTHETARDALKAGCKTQRELMVYVERRRAEARAKSNRAGRRNHFALNAVHKVGRAGE